LLLLLLIISIAFWTAYVLPTPGVPDNRKHRDTIDGGIDGDEWFESKMVCNALTISPSGESITLVDDDVDDDVDGIASLPPVMAAAAAVAVVG
jgi:hypothetical protein